MRLSGAASSSAVAMNRTVGLLFVDLLDVMDRGVVFEMIADYLATLRRPNAEHVQASSVLVRPIEQIISFVIDVCNKK